jgi:hypothetical protein
MKQIYIAHAARDNNHMSALRDHLTRAGYRPVVNRHLRASGQGWQMDVVDSIRKSHAVVVIATRFAAESVDVTYEWSLALGAGVKVLPVIFRGVNAHPHLMIQETFDFGAYSDEDQFWAQFIRELQRVLGDEGQTTAFTSVAYKPPQDDLDMPKNTGFCLIISHGTKPKRTFRLESDSVSLGREPSNDIQIDDAGVSRAHLRFVRSDKGYRALDMGSTNGTMMGDKRVDMVELKPGDILRIGDTIELKFTYIP